MWLLVFGYEDAEKMECMKFYLSLFANFPFSFLSDPICKPSFYFMQRKITNKELK